MDEGGSIRDAILSLMRVPVRISILNKIYSQYSASLSNQEIAAIRSTNNLKLPRHSSYSSQEIELQVWYVTQHVELLHLEFS